MIVVGGTYDEIVVVPDSEELMGSGMRAAAALAGRGEGAALLYTAVDEGLEEEAELVAGALGFATRIVGRDERVGFRYVTPISTPAINGPNSRLRAPIQVDAADETVLAFGMVEDAGGQVSIDAGILVFDPQRPRDAEPLDMSKYKADRAFVVANSFEMQKLGNDKDHREAAANLLQSTPSLEGAITKRGASGCLASYRVGSEIEHTLVGAHPTSRVWPIGSGDTFSAGVAHALDAGASLVEAARVGSAAAAHWCSTRDPAIPLSILSGDFGGLPAPISPTGGRVYLAGPFFTVAERWLIETVRDQLYSLGVDVWSPVHEVGHGGLEVAKADLQGLRKCDAVLALLDHEDPGTVFEVGWAARENYPIVGFASVLDEDGAKMMAGTTVELHRDLSTACYRAAWAVMGLRPVPGWAHA